MDHFRQRTSRSAALLVVGWLGAAVSGFGQQAGVPAARPLSSPETPDAYGTSSLTCYTLHAYDFLPFAPGTSVQGDSVGGRYLSGGSNFALEAAVHLPSGAVIDHFELEACDTNVTNDVQAFLARCVDGVCTIAPFGLAQTSGAPGCARLSSPVGAATVDNQTTDYFMQVTLTTFDASLSLRAVRIYYRLQVSPGPAVATFADVPTTSPLFKFVEALVSAGVTAGCGNGNFCPGDPVTRGQIAVFLASALGLHFPN